LNTKNVPRQLDIYAWASAEYEVTRVVRLLREMVEWEREMVKRIILLQRK
jgi:hypothetical protein